MPSPSTGQLLDIPAVERDLERELSSLRASKRNTLVGTIILAAAMLGYMSWMYSQVNRLIDEEDTAAQVQYFVRETLPQAHARIRTAMTVTLPQMVDQGFDMANSSLPEAREWLELYLVGKVEKAFRSFEAKIDATFAAEMAKWREKIREHILAMRAADKRENIEIELSEELRQHYQRAALSRLLPEFFTQWSTVTAEQALGVIREKLQAFESELQRLCNTPQAELAVPDRERRMMVLCLTAYLESLFAEEGQAIVERLTYIWLRATQQAQQSLLRAAEPAPAAWNPPGTDAGNARPE